MKAAAVFILAIGAAVCAPIGQAAAPAKQAVSAPKASGYIFPCLKASCYPPVSPERKTPRKA